MQHKLWTISELADELNVTTRTIRFYEDKDLCAAALRCKPGV